MEPQRLNDPKLRIAMKESIMVQGNILLFVKKGTIKLACGSMKSRS